MKMSPELQAQYESCRLRMHALNKNFSRYLWISIALGALFFGTAFMAGALSTLEQRGPAKFYFAMSAGVIQILLALATAILGWMTASKRRIPSMILLGIYAACTLFILFNMNGTMAGANIFFLLSGCAVNVWAQMLCNENDALKEMPGYPLFSVEADTPAEYEAPLHVTARRAAGDMDTVGGTPAAAQSAPKQTHAPALQPADLALDEFVGKAGGSTAPAIPKASGDIALAAFDASASGGKAQTGMDALPQANPADMLADMTAIPSHAVRQGDKAALPAPEEVRARLAAMKTQREADSQQKIT